MILDLKDFFTLNTSVTTRNTENKIYIEYRKTNTRKYYFSHRVAPTWNSLATNIKVSTNINTFMNRRDQDQNFNDSRYEFDKQVQENFRKQTRPK